MRRLTLKSAQDIQTLLREARMDRGWSRSRLAHEAHVSPAMASFSESGDRIPHVPTLIRLLNALGYDLCAVRRRP